jgi:hypothetical protein
MIQNRVAKVELFDKLKRKEQRAMQNVEIDDIENKKVRFYLKDQSGKEFNHSKISNEYIVLWNDSKMKNYLSFLEFLEKKKFIHARITAILIVDKEEHLRQVEKIRKQSKVSKVKDEVRVMMVKELDQTEVLKREATEEGDDQWVSVGEEVS